MTTRKATHRSGERGQILVFIAVSLVAVLGIGALSIDAAYLYDKRNKLYAAADAAAKSGAFEVHRNSGISNSDLWTFASQEVSALGFTPVVCGANGGASVCVYHPPRPPSPFSTDTSYVEAVVSEESTSTFFGRILGWMTANPGARAVAGAGAPNACLIVQEDVNLGNTCPPGNVSLNLNGCGASIGGDLYGNNPTSCISGTPIPPVSVTGSCYGTCSSMGNLSTGAPKPIDPLANLPAFSNPYPTCTAGTAPTLSPGCYTSISNDVMTLQQGEYYITGTVNISNLSGNGVFLYIAGGRLHAANNKSLTLTAMSTPGTYSGTTYKGIAIFQERGDIENFDTGQNFTLSVNGAIYMPSVDVHFPNSLNFVQTGCTLFIAKSLTIENGKGVMSNNGCASSFGGAAFLSVTMSE